MIVVVAAAGRREGVKVREGSKGQKLGGSNRFRGEGVKVRGIGARLLGDEPGIMQSHEKVVEGGIEASFEFLV